MRFAKWRAQALCLPLLTATILVVGYLFMNWKSPSFFKIHPTVLHSRLEDALDNNFPVKQHVYRGLMVGAGFGIGTLIKSRACLQCGDGNRAGIVAIIALFSSNCCLLQVILMALGSAGCAGFAKIAEPIRPLLDLILGASLWGVWASVSSSPTAGGKNSKFRGVTKKVIITIICLALAGSEEILFLWRTKMWRAERVEICNATLDKSVPLEVVMLEVDGMGCEACRTKVYKTIQEDPFVSTVISVKGGRKEKQGEAIFTLSPINRSNETALSRAESLDLLLDNLGKQGYPSRKRSGPLSVPNLYLAT